MPCAVSDLLARVHLVDLHPDVLARALEPFPRAVRTMDALHLASMVYLRAAHVDSALAAYDQRLCDSATALDIPLHPV